MPATMTLPTTPVTFWAALGNLVWATEATVASASCQDNEARNAPATKAAP